jgi:hydrophobic/amphiphilic exporter-1 (mainly G- bacteria), HAE1 family
MAKFFVDRPIVAIVIAILTVLLGGVAILRLPIAQFPAIAPPEIQLQTTYVGADASTVEQTVATPIEQEMSGVDDMLYMYSTNASNGELTLKIDFDVATVPNTDQILVQMRYLQAESQVPSDVKDYGVTIKKSVSSPLALFSLYSPKGTYDALFLTNYAFTNLHDPLSRTPGIGQVSIFGAGQYAMRFWVDPDTLAKLGITVADILHAIKTQNTVNPSGQVGAEPVPPGQQFTYSVRAQGRLVTEQQFGDIVVRANVDGSLVRLRDVARIELGSQTYGMIGRLDGAPAAIVAIYQLPRSNALDTMRAAEAFMRHAKEQFPDDLDYVVSLDTTQAVTEGIREILKTLAEAILLVMIVVFVFLQSVRATLIPLLAVPVSLVGTFAVFPLLGFSINTLSLFGVVLAIGIVVDDAIVVVEAVEHHIERGVAPREATLLAMEQVSGPVVAIALILAAVFIPTAFVPGITGRVYQQFAVTIAVSVVLSAFNALTLSPALSALLLRPRAAPRGFLGEFFRWFNRSFSRITDGYVGLCRLLIRRAALAVLALIGIAVAGGLVGLRLPRSFLPEEDQGYFYMNLQLPNAASLQRTDVVSKEIESVLRETPGVATFNTVVGYSLLSGVSTTYNAFYFVTLTPWRDRDASGRTAAAILDEINRRLYMMPDAEAFGFPPPAIPGVGTSGGVTFMLEDRSGAGPGFLAANMATFMRAARKRPEFAAVTTTFLPDVPQLLAEVDRDKVLKQGVDLHAVYETLQAFMGGTLVNYFNRFGRTWQVYVEAEGASRTDAENVGRFYVENSRGEPVPLAAVVSVRKTSGPEFTMRYNGYPAAQITALMRLGVSSAQGMAALEQVFSETQPGGMGFDYMGMSFEEQAAAQGVPASAIFGLSLFMVFLILAAQYESWTLPLSVLLAVPVAVCGALVALSLRGFANNVYAQIGLVTLIGLAAKNAILIVEFARQERHAGRSIVDAALSSGRMRLRPILMTAFAFILGVVPLALASGAGAQARRELGTAVIGGMLAASGIAIFLIPFCFYAVERLAHHHPGPVTPEQATPLGVTEAT